MNWPEVEMAIMTLAANAIQFAANWLIQSTLLICAGLVLGQMLRQRGSAAESLIYRTTLVAVLICPLVTGGLGKVGVSGWSVTIEPGYTYENATLTPPVAWNDGRIERAAPAIPDMGESQNLSGLASGPASAAIPSENQSDVDVQPASSTPTQPAIPVTKIIQPTTLPARATWVYDISWFGLISPFILAFWVIASGYLLARLGASWWRMSHLLRKANAVDPATGELCKTLASRLEVSPPEVLRSPFIYSPCLAGLGVIKPAKVLLPADEIELPMRDVLVHELAHLRRRDCCWNLLRQIATAVYFFQPLLWVLSRRIEITAEEVCDDIVVHSGGDRQEYAHRLVDIAELSSDLSAAAVAAAGVGIVSLRSMLARRVERILDTRRSLSTRVGNLLMIAVLLGGVGGTAIVGFVGLGHGELVVADEAAADEAATSATTDEEESDPTDKRLYAGRVVDEHGNAVSGADIYLTGHILESTGLFERNWKPITKSDADGRFRFNFAPSDLGAGVTEYEFKYTLMVAAKEGFGFGVAPGDRFLDESNDPTIPLAPDHSIRGRILDINGQPVVGARLTVFRVYSNNQHDLSDWMAEAAKPRADFYSAREHVSTISAGALVRSVVQPAITNEKGEFVMTGVGKGRIVRLLLEGEGIETQKVRVRTEPGETVTLLREARSPDLGSWTFYPAEFEHVCGPSIPVVGIVRDQVTGQPIAGATVKSQALHGERINGLGSDFVRAVTDAGGRYRLTGLPIGSDNRIGVIVPDGDIAFPSHSKSADTSIAAGDEDQLVMNFDMTPGVWLSGRIVDAETGQGLTGQIQCLVDRSNPNSKLLRRGVDERDRLRPGDDGSFRVPVFPGKGYLAFLADNASDYPRATSIVKPDGSEEPAPEMINSSPSLLLAQNNNIVAEIIPEAGTTEYELNLTLSAGETRTGQVIGPDKKPVTGFYYFGDTRHFSSWKRVEGSEFTLKGCRDDVPRLVYIADTERNLAGFAEVLGGSTAPIQVEVAKAGSAKGRVVDQDGEPLAFRSLLPLQRSLPEPGMMQNKVPIQPPFYSAEHRYGRLETDAEGRFEFACLLPGTEYRLRVKPDDDPGYYRPLDVVINVKAGEAKDLGDVVVSDNPDLLKEVEESAQLNTEQSTLSTEATDSAAHAKAVHAKIVLPDGGPAASSHVAVIGYDRQSQRMAIFAQAVSDAAGDCQLATDGETWTGGPGNPRFIIARLDGFGIAWKSLSNTDQGDVSRVQLQLRSQGIVEGKLVDIEGQPAAGETLLVQAVVNPQANGTAVDAAIGYYIEPNAEMPLAWLQPVTTDENGKFRLHGIPENHGVHLTLVGSTKFAPQEIALNTGRSEQRGDRDATYRSLVKNVDAGDVAILTLSPAKVITGTITYEDSGEPVANARVTVWASQQKYGSMISVGGETDADGRYRMLPKPGIRFGVTAYPPSGVPYMARRADEIDWENSDLTRETNIKLPRVALVRGRVLEEGTDKPIAGATVTFENGQESSKLPANVITGWQAAQETDSEGHFTFAVPPGRGTLLVRKNGGNYVYQHRMSRQIRYGLPGGYRLYAHGIELIHAEQGKTVDVEIRLQPGETVSGQIVDQDRKLVDDAFVITNLIVWDTAGQWRGSSDHYLGGNFELLGLDPGKDYQVSFLEPHRKLGATVNLRGGQTNVKIQLQPCGSARAKFNLDDPDREFSPTVNFVAAPGIAKYDSKNARLGLVAADSDFNANVDRVNYRQPLAKDEDGYDVFPALIPGATYRLFTRETGDDDYQDFNVKAGETLELGEFTPKFDD